MTAEPGNTINSTATGTAKTWLALGDSYTIGEAVPESDRYPVQTVMQLRDKNIHFENPEIIATTGWTTADLLQAISNRNITGTYDMVSLLIGVNNQYQGRSREEYEEQFTALLQQAIRLAGNRAGHVMVLSIPDYSVTPFGQHTGNAAAISEEIDSFNAINKKIAASNLVHYIDVTGESRKAAGDHELIAADGLHFSGKEYAVWASLITQVIVDCSRN